MRTEGLVFAGTAAFFAVITTLYWFTSYEEAGSTMLLLTVGLGLIPGVWLLWWSRRMAPRPEDRQDADIADGAGAIGSFPGATAWPATLGLGAVLAANGIAFGIWPAVPGFVLLVVAACGATMSGRPTATHAVDRPPATPPPHGQEAPPPRTTRPDSAQPPAADRTRRVRRRPRGTAGT